MCFTYIKRNFVAKHENDLSFFIPLLTIRDGTVQLFHGSDHGFRVTVSVRLGMFREKLYGQIKIKKIRIINLNTSNSTNKYNRVNIQIK